MNNYSTTPVKQRLIEAGIEEIANNGLHNFSVRRVASICQVSCAAPYKHFQNKESFIAAVIEYINNMWFNIQKKVLSENQKNERKQIVELSIAYVKFLVDNPLFRQIIMQADSGFNNKYKEIRSKLSGVSKAMAEKYCYGAGFSKDDTLRKTYIVRSLIYGAALMFDNGQLPYSNKYLEFVRMSINREFDLP